MSDRAEDVARDEPVTISAVDHRAPLFRRFRIWTPMQIWVLFLLALVNISNYLDRGVLSILQEPIKEELLLADWQLGLISGPAFALLYSISGIPAARIADRFDRITVLSIAITIWSGMTARCGAATSFAQLALARIGVGAGEGACTPVSHSLISDHFPPRQRGMALSILTTSIPMAQLVAPLIGGVIAMQYGWRTAFVVVGLPGIAVALLLRLTLTEPRNDAANQMAAPARKDAGRFRDDLRLLFGNRAFVWHWLGATFLGQAIGATNMFTASYFLRQYDLTLAEVGAIIAAGLGAAGLVGTFLGGWLSDRFAGEYGRSYPWVCAIAATGAGLMFTGVFTSASWQIALGFLLIANIMNDLKNGPVYAAVQNMAPTHMRSTATAIVLVGAIALGTGMGPMIVGVVSDLAAAGHLPDALGAYSRVCPGGKPLPELAQQLGTACAEASAAGIRSGLLAACLTYALAAPCFAMAALKIRQPLEGARG